MFKKIASVIVATFMLCWCLPMNVYAQETTANAEQSLRGPVCPFDSYTVVVSRNYETTWGPTFQASNSSSSAEVGVNTSYSEDVVININAPAYSTVYARSGSKKVYGIAELRQLNTDCSVDVIKRYSYNYSYNVATEWW